MRGASRRPFYWQEFLEQCRFIMTANFIPLLLTGLGFGTIVALEAGQFFKATSAEYRLGGFTALPVPQCRDRGWRRLRAGNHLQHTNTKSHLRTH